MTGTSDDTVTTVTSPADLVRAEDEITGSAAGVAEAPSFSGPTSFSGGEAGSFALAGIAVTTRDSGDTLGATATLSGLPTGWTLYDGAAALTSAGGVATLPTTDLGALVILAPDHGSEAATLTLTVSSSEGSSTTSGSEALVVSVTGAAGDSDDTATLAPQTVSGSFSSATVSDTAAHASISGSSNARSGALATTASNSRVEFKWQRYDAGSWWDISSGLSPYTFGAGFTIETSQLCFVRAEDANLLGIRAEVTVIDDSGVTVATVDSPSIAPILDGFATLWFVGSDIASLTTVDGSAGSNTYSAAAAASITTTDPTATINGSPIESSTLTASAVITGPFTGTTEFHWQRFYAGSWWNTPVELAPYTSGEILTYETSATYVVREEDENVQAIRVEADFVDTAGSTVATADSPSIGPVLDEPATLSLSPITGSAVEGATLTVSGLVTSDDYTGPPVFHWQRYYSGGWWDIPIELSPYTSGEVLTYVTAPTYVVRAEDDYVLAIRVEASFIDDTGQTFTALSATGTGGAALTISKPPLLTAADATLGEDAASVALAITDVAHDSGYTLGSVTISGVPLGWSLNHGTTSGNASTWIETPALLSGLVLVAPCPDESGNFTLSVTASETASGPTGIVTATATTSFAVTVTDVAEAPVFGTPTITYGGGDDPDDRAVLSLPVSKFDADDTLGTIATISGVPTGWTVGTIVGSSGSHSGAVALSGLGSLEVLRRDGDFAHVATLTLTVSSSEGSSTTSGSETIRVTLDLSDDPAGVAGNPINLALADPGGATGAIDVTISAVPAGWSLNQGTDLGGGTWAAQTTDPSGLAITTPAGFVGAAVLRVNESWINPDGSSGSEFVSDNVEAYAPGNPIFALSTDDTLTGSGANDLFVFAQPIGNDRIYDFTPVSDRINLIGFSGISSFADLQANMANDANGNAVLTLGSGKTITLVGVGAASLGAANFVFNEEPTTRNSGTMAIGDGATLPLGGTIDNTGTIALNSAGDESELVILSDGVTLRGGGEVTLSDNAGNEIAGSGAQTTLTNLDNTISGAGRIGDDAMTLRNAGVIDATGVNPLIIDTGSNSVVNSGTIEATGAGGLVISGAVVNSGTLSADGGNLTVDGTVTGNGIAMIAGRATLEFGAASAENTSFANGAAGTLKLDQSADFTGTVSGFAGGDAIDLADLAFGSNTTLRYTDNGAGGGTLTVGNGVQVVDLALLGQYAAAGFQAQSDPGGGTLITYSSQTSSTDPTSLTNPSH